MGNGLNMINKKTSDKQTATFWILPVVNQSLRKWISLLNEQSEVLAV
jgi:hypothetical protein